MEDAINIMDYADKDLREFPGYPGHEEYLKEQTKKEKKFYNRSKSTVSAWVNNHLITFENIKKSLKDKKVVIKETGTSLKEGYEKETKKIKVFFNNLSKIAKDYYHSHFSDEYFVPDEEVINESDKIKEIKLNLPEREMSKHRGDILPLQKIEEEEEVKQEEPFILKEVKIEDINEDANKQELYNTPTIELEDQHKKNPYVSPIIEIKKENLKKEEPINISIPDTDEYNRSMINKTKELKQMGYSREEIPQILNISGQALDDYNKREDLIEKNRQSYNDLKEKYSTVEDGYINKVNEEIEKKTSGKGIASDQMDNYNNLIQQFMNEVNEFKTNLEEEKKFIK